MSTLQNKSSCLNLITHRWKRNLRLLVLQATSLSETSMLLAPSSSQLEARRHSWHSPPSASLDLLATPTTIVYSSNVEQAIWTYDGLNIEPHIWLSHSPSLQSGVHEGMKNLIRFGLRTLGVPTSLSAQVSSCAWHHNNQMPLPQAKLFFWTLASKRC